MFVHQPRTLTIEEFGRIGFGNHMAELDNGNVYMVSAATEDHSRVASNVAAGIKAQISSRDRPVVSSDAFFRSNDLSLRQPDVLVCNDVVVTPMGIKLAVHPIIVFELVTGGLARTNVQLKLLEYRNVESLEAIVFVDAVKETVRTLHRQADRGWIDNDFAAVDIVLPSINAMLTRAEIFARD